MNVRRKIFSTPAGWLAAAGAAAMAGTACASPVVQNASFESPVLAYSNYTTTTPPSWSSSGFADLGEDNASDPPFTNADGSNYFYGDGATTSEYLYQDLGEGFTPDTTYIVDLLGADRTSANVGASGIYFGLTNTTSTPVALTGAITGHITLASEEAAPDTFVDGAAAGNTEFTFTTGSVVPTGDIVAYITSDGNYVYTGRINADNFALTVAAVPEPAVVGFALAAAFPLLGRPRRVWRYSE